MATVLVVDDRAINRDLVRTILGYEGHRVLEADSGAQALRLLQRDEADLMISDVLMPGMDGYELAREVRALPGTRDLPIVFYTANYLEREARPIAAACGVEHIVPKDGDPRALVDAVAKALSTAPAPAPVAAEDDFSRAHLRVLNAKLMEKVRELEEKDRLTQLVDAAVVVGGDLGLDTTLERIARTARTLVSAQHASVELTDDTGYVLGTAASGPAPGIDEIVADESSIRLPISTVDGQRGMLTIVGTGTGEAFTPADRELIAGLAGATNVDVVVTLSGPDVVVVVSDDGCGLPPGREERGLANLRQRAAAAGGRMTTEPAATGTGLVLTWRVPLPV